MNRFLAIPVLLLPVGVDRDEIADLRADSLFFAFFVGKTAGLHIGKKRNAGKLSKKVDYFHEDSLEVDRELSNMT